MLRTLTPVLRGDQFVYARVDAPTAAPYLATAAAVVVEEEGVTLVLRRSDADQAGIPYDFVAAWITLTVHSSLEAVGLTAAFSAALGDAGISCNVLAGSVHDHILVPWSDREAAVAALRTLRG